MTDLTGVVHRGLVVSADVQNIVLPDDAVLFSKPPHVWIPGTVGNYVSTPDSAAVSITGDIDIVCRVSLVDWTPPANSALVSKWVDAASDRTFIFYVNTSGNLVLQYSRDGAENLSSVSTIANNFDPDSIHWLRVTRNTTTGVATFYTSTDGKNWTVFGSTVAGSIGGFVNGAAAVRLGSYGSGDGVWPLAGRVFHAEIRNGIDTAAISRFAPASDALSGDTSFLSSTGEIWTITSTVVDPALLIGGSNTLNLSGSARDDDGAYIGMTARLLSGVGAGQIRVITAYDGEAKRVTVETPWTTIPNIATPYEIVDLVGVVDHETGMDRRRPHWMQGADRLDKLLKTGADAYRELEIVMLDLERLRTIDNALGSQLDGIGEILNVAREIGQDDTSYRFALRTAMILLAKSGDAESVINAYRSVTASPVVRYLEIYPATIQISGNPVADISDPAVGLFLNQTMQGIKPAGVNLLLTSATGFTLSRASEADVNGNGPTSTTEGFGSSTPGQNDGGGLSKVI